MPWLLKFVGSILLLLLLLKLAGGASDRMVVVTTDEQNIVSIGRYINDQAPSVVLVGSSLSFRLSERYFSSLKVDNLAITGGSTVTGLQIIAEGATNPQLVIIETNILVRPIDKDILHTYRSRRVIGQPIRMVAHAYEEWRHPPRSRDQINQEVDAIISSTPSGTGSQHQMARAVADSYPDYPRAAIEANIGQMKRLIAKLNMRGIKTVLVEIPQPRELDPVSTVAMSRHLVREAFPDNDEWLTLDIIPSELRWSDGTHLDKRSAAIVARAIEVSARRLLTRN